MISSINCMKPTLLQMIGEEHSVQNWCVCVLDFQVSPQNGFPPSGAGLRFYASRRREKLAWELRNRQNGFCMGEISFQEESVWCLKKIMAIFPSNPVKSFAESQVSLVQIWAIWQKHLGSIAVGNWDFGGHKRGSTWLARFCKIRTWVQVKVQKLVQKS